MIQITAYLRDEADLALWNAIPRGRKTQFLHDALRVQSNSKGSVYSNDTFEDKKLVSMASPELDDPKPIPPTSEVYKDASINRGIAGVATIVEESNSIVNRIKTPKQAKKAAAKIARPNGKFCPIHGSPLDGRGKCLQKGCKYA